MENKKLSIITICYNDIDAKKTCESIVNQTFQNFEWIVVDGGSKKEVLDIFENYKGRIDKFISEPDTGVYNAYNKGLKLASSPWVHFLNSGDCYFDNNVLKNVFENKEYNADIVYGDMKSVKNTLFNKGRVYKIPEKIEENYFINANIATPSTFIKKELFEKFGNFNENYKIVSDLERWIVFQQNRAKFEHVPFIISLFDMNGLSSNKKNKLTRRIERKKVFEEHYSKEVFEKAVKSHKQELSIGQRIFSVTNSTDNEHKIVTILNIPFYIKRKKIN